MTLDRLLGVGLFSGLLAVIGCGSEKASEAGCQTDDQCKEGRICVEGTCVYPGSDGGYSGVTPSTGNGGTTGGTAGSNGSSSNGGNTSQPSCTTHDSQSCYLGDVYWMNSCGEWEEQAIDCTDTQYCNAGACVEGEAQCDAQAAKTCYSDDVYWLDSCGNVGELFTDCSPTQYCQDSQCVEMASECTPHASKTCSDGDVYWRDSCGSLEEIAENCSSTQYCNNADCVNQPLSCTPHASTICYDGDIYWENSCGEREGVAESCGTDETCENARCIVPEPSCNSHSTRICYDGDAYWQNSCGDREDISENCSNQQICQNGRCQTPPRFQVLGDSTVRDNQTGLFWQEETSPTGLIFDQATTYCNSLDSGETLQWRLPTKSEILEVMQYENDCLWPLEFGGACDWFWTQTPCEDNSPRLEAFHLLYRVEDCRLPDNDYVYARCLGE